MKKLLTILFITSLAAGFIIHARSILLASVPTPLLVHPQQNSNLTDTQAQQAFAAQVRDAKNKLAPIMRQVQFASSDLSAIKKALEQSKRQVDQMNRSVEEVNLEQEKFRGKFSTYRQQLANVQRIFKELREKCLNVTSEARQRAAEAQRLARSTTEIERSAGLAHQQEAWIKNCESLLTAMQNQLNKIEVITAGLGK